MYHLPTVTKHVIHCVSTQDTFNYYWYPNPVSTHRNVITLSFAASIIFMFGVDACLQCMVRGECTEDNYVFCLTTFRISGSGNRCNKPIAVLISKVSQVSVENTNNRIIVTTVCLMTPHMLEVRYAPLK
jgi:hypothetical protein